jgi:hypothetical protein
MGRDIVRFLDRYTGRAAGRTLLPAAAPNNAAGNDWIFILRAIVTG